jgi:hypothetical protein
VLRRSTEDLQQAVERVVTGVAQSQLQLADISPDLLQQVITVTGYLFYFVPLGDNVRVCCSHAELCETLIHVGLRLLQQFSAVTQSWCTMHHAVTVQMHAGANVCMSPPMSLSLAPDWGSHSLLSGACEVK